MVFLPEVKICVPRFITIFELEVLEYKLPNLKIRVKCSSGTYIRSLAHDIGQELGCGAYLEKLVRTKIGEYRLEDANEIEDIEEDWGERLFGVSD